MQLTVFTFSIIILLPQQERDWKKENFAGPVPEEIARSKNGRIELVNILGSRRWRHSSEIRSVVFSPDGRRALSGSLNDTLRLWDVESGKELATGKGHAAAIWSVAFSPDGKRALSGSRDKTLKLWDVESMKELGTWTGHAYSVNSVTFSPDGRRALSGSSDHTLKLWDVKTGRQIDSIEVDGGPKSLAIRRDLVLVGNRNTTVTVYRINK